MTTSKRLWMAACLICGLGAVSPVSAQGLFAGNMPAEGVGALPTRARKTSAPEITTPLKFEALRNETHPGLKGSQIVGESVVRLLGAGFGESAGGRVIQLRMPGAEPLVLEVLSWRDDVIRVRIPSLAELGFDPKAMTSMKAQLTPKKHVVGPNVEIGIAHDQQFVVKARVAQLAVVYRDLDGDGYELDDCDDFDPRRHPGAKEVVDAESLDEDCNPDTLATEELAAVSDPLAL